MKTGLFNFFSLSSLRRCLLLLPLALPLAGCAHHSLRAISSDARVELPADVLPHPRAQTEWWHVHADLKDVRNGEELHVFAAFLMQRTDLDRVAGLPVSLVVNPFHAAWVQVTDGEQVWNADRYNFPDLFAARNVGPGLDLRHNGWRLAYEESCWVLKVDAGPHAIELRLTPTAEPVLPGEAGLVELRPGDRHQWVQEEALQVDGRWVEGIDTRWVEGSGFVKHQWGRIYNESHDGFNWFSLDLPASASESDEAAPPQRAEVKLAPEPEEEAAGEDGATEEEAQVSAKAAEEDPREAEKQTRREAQALVAGSESSLSIAWLLDDGMSGVEGSRAWVSNRRGGRVEIPASRIRVTSTRTWKSLRSGARWPVAWHIEGPGFDLELESLVKNQEIWAFPAPIHVGPARAHGEWFGQPVDTLAFVEQAGGSVSPLRVLLDSREPR